MKKICITIALEGCKLSHVELKNIAGGGGCTYTNNRTGEQVGGLSQAQAERLASMRGGECSC